MSGNLRNVPARPASASGSRDANLNTERIMTIFVGQGPDAKACTVHAAYFASLSPVLKHKFDEPPDEPVYAANNNPRLWRRDSIKLPDDNYKIFNMVRNWVYAVAFSGKGTVPKIEENEPDPDVEEVKMEEGVAPSKTLDNVVTATPREIMELYVLAHKLQMISLKNAAVDALFEYYHGPDSTYFVADAEQRDSDQKPQARQIRRCPNMRDVQWLFDNTSKMAKIRQLLVVSALFFMFFKRPNGKGLPAEWQEVLTEKGEIGYEMVKMMGTWGWVLGQTVPSMKIKSPCTFHDAHEQGRPGRCGAIQISGENSRR